ncbi:alpha-amylase family protein [Pseudonocardia bannensis]|uniref:alpha-amylase family protein n=1 Tax=Pseudonocardia bannensis TaxID=630973 RepID=UPI0028A94DDB|nr:alpha-amylase family protein [Pseudonocardia bannensis]
MIAPRPDAERRRRAAAALRRLRPALVGEAEQVLGRAEAVAFLARLDLWFADVHGPLDALYPGALDELVARLVRSALRAAAERPADLRETDRRREVDPRWYQDPRMVGYVAYTDRFCGTLDALPAQLDYLAELGVSYLHLMPLLRPREGENDGGYAVADYRSVDPRLGTMDDLEKVARALRDRGMSLCVDLVLNHTAREHPWAQGWLAGDPAYADFYLVFGDRTMPDAYEATIAEVFPDRAPGSFTWVPEAQGGAGGWVWTTFWAYQWDLNYANPNVFAAMLETILWLANRGIEIFRMDAVPFMWKRLGTPCMNQPEVHDLIQALHALVKLAAPATVFKAEAIVSPEDLVPYLGGHARYRPECELAYHNQLMVMLWSSLATKDARLATASLGRMRPIPPETSWATYVRCHDDIGWAVSDIDAAAVGWDGAGHRRFLNDFYAGRFPVSFARGALFQENLETGDARISGSAASLCGITDARERDDPVALELGIRRLVLLHAVTYAWGGVPLLYMGDELALGDDTRYLDDPALAQDNRWMHRPWMDPRAQARRHDPSTVEGRVFGWLRTLAHTRRELLALHAVAAPEVLDLDDPHVLGWRRRHPRSGWFVGLVNMAEHPASVDLSALGGLGELETVLASDEPRQMRDGRAHLPGLGFAWLAEA